MNTASEPIAIDCVIVDDHAVVRAGIARLLGEMENVQVVAEVGTLADALEKIEVKRPRLVLLDLELPDGNALDIVPQALKKSPDTRVLVLSAHDEPHLVEQAFEAGVHGYLLKDAAEDDLEYAIAAVNRGERYVHPSLGARLAQASLQQSNDPLTDREREIARLLALGHTNQDIAGQLYVSVRTVESHRAHLMSKLRMSSRPELVQWALDTKLIGDDSFGSSEQ